MPDWVFPAVVGALMLARSRSVSTGVSKEAFTSIGPLVWTPYSLPPSDQEPLRDTSAATSYLPGPGY